MRRNDQETMIAGIGRYQRASFEAIDEITPWKPHERVGAAELQPRRINSTRRDKDSNLNSVQHSMYTTGAAQTRAVEAASQIGHLTAAPPATQHGTKCATRLQWAMDASIGAPVGCAEVNAHC